MGQILREDEIGVLSELANAITLASSILTIGGQQYSTSSLNVAADISSATTQYHIYAVLNAGNVELVTSLNDDSVGPAGYSAWKRVGSYFTDTVINFDYFVTDGVKKQSMEFSNKAGITVRADSAANHDISTLANGVTIGSPPVALVTGNLILLKDQTDTSENGVYVVGATPGTTVRHADYDSAEKLNRAVVFVNNQDDNTQTPPNITARWYQNNTLASLSDPQNWTNTPTYTYSFTVPAGVTVLDILACGAGGGGGGAAGNGSGHPARRGAGGGAGATPQKSLHLVTPGEILTISLGIGGNAGGRGINNSVSAGGPGLDGSETTVTSVNIDTYAPGAKGGTQGTDLASGVGGVDFTNTGISVINPAVAGGNGSTSTNNAGSNGGKSYYIGTESLGGTSTGNGGGGGGSGSGIDPGVPGAAGGTAGSPGLNGTKGAGGSGAAGNPASSGFGAIGGFGGDGAVIISWIGE